MTHDVAVVGAGLAGLQVARLLAARGLSVALLDRKESLAAPVHTTGIFVRKTWEDFPLPQEQLGPGIRDVVLYSPKRKILALQAAQAEFRIGRMSWLYLYLLEQCARAGVKWMPGTRVTDIDDIDARFIVGADGARSMVARQLGLDRNRELLLGYEEVIPPIGDEPALHCFLDPRLAPGYIAWIANDGEEAHIGVAGYREGWEPAQALHMFRGSAPFRIGKPVERHGGWIPVNGILRGIANRRGLLVGDAAGAVSPLTAGGLDGALRLSAFAAEVVAAYLEREDEAVLREYTGSRFASRFISRKFMRNILRVTQTEFLTELAFSALRTPALRPIAGHVFFARGSFPDVRRIARYASDSIHSANAG
jgi:flavin-dependent dehydrogenase